MYFSNVLDYRKKHPLGYWPGEHALYLGSDQFSGFGLYGLTNDEMLAKLLERYNASLPASEHKTLGDVPGILPQVIRRPVVGGYAR